MKKTNAIILSLTLLSWNPAQAGFWDWITRDSSKQIHTTSSNKSSSNGNHHFGGNNGNGVGNTNPGNQGHGPNQGWAGSAGGPREVKTPHHNNHGHNNPGHHPGDGCDPKPPHNNPPPNNNPPPGGGDNNPPTGGGGGGGGDFPGDGGGFGENPNPPPDEGSGGPVNPNNNEPPGGSNGGNENNGDNDNDNNNNQQQEEQQQQQEKKNSKWRGTVIPVPYLDFDFGKKIIMDDEEAPDLKGGNFTSSDTRYRVVRYYNVDVGVGVAVVFHEVPVTISSFMPMVGLLPITGTQAQVDRHVFGRAAIDAVRVPSFPPKAEEVLSWQNGDSVTYQSRGGLVFFGGAGIAAGVGGAISLYAEGSWITRVEKANETTVVAKVSKSKLDSYRANFGSTIAALSVDKFQTTDDGFAFRFDLRDASAFRAYQDFIRGNFATAQKQFLKKNSAVQPERVISALSKGHSWNLWLGIPILANFVSSSGKVYTHSESVDVEDNQQGPVITKSKIDYGVYNFSKKSKFFFRHSSTVGSFFGSHFATVAEEGPVGSGEIGKFIWNYETDVASPKKVKNALEELAEVTGLDNDLIVNVPQIDDLGYVNVQFTMDIPDETTDYLVSLGSSYSLHNTLMGYAGAANSTYIIRDCQNYMTDFGADPCITNENRRVEFEMRAVTEALREMYLASKREDWPAFARAYGSFGKAILKSRNTYQTFLAMVKGKAPLAMVLEVTGERFAKQRRVILN